MSGSSAPSKMLISYKQDFFAVILAKTKIWANYNLCQAIDPVQGGGKHHLTLYLEDTDQNSEGINYPYPPNIEGTDIILYHS